MLYKHTVSKENLADTISVGVIEKDLIPSSDSGYKRMTVLIDIDSNTVLFRVGTTDKTKLHSSIDKAIDYYNSL